MGSLLQEILVFSNCDHTAVTNISAKMTGGASTIGKGDAMELSDPWLQKLHLCVQPKKQLATKTPHKNVPSIGHWRSLLLQVGTDQLLELDLITNSLNF
jgi:hypothetical protein